MSYSDYKSIETNPEELDRLIIPFIKNLVKDFIEKNPECNSDYESMEAMIVDVILFESFRPVDAHLTNARVALYNEMLTKCCGV